MIGSVAVERVGQREHGGGQRVFGVKKVLGEELLDLRIHVPTGGETSLGARAGNWFWAASAPPASRLA